jgi:hypothetical protein
MADADEKASAFLSDVTERQMNVLPHDIIRHDADVDDVLWHGSKHGFGIQRAGAFVIGSMLVLSAFAAGVEAAQKGARLFLVPMIVIGAGGSRVIYKSLVGRKREGI